MSFQSLRRLFALKLFPADIRLNISGLCFG